MRLPEGLSIHPASAPSTVQAFGTRPPGLPQEIRQSPAWEHLRRAIYRRAMRLTDHLQFDFRDLLTDAGHARQAGALMWRLVKPLAPQVLIGPGFGAAPLLFGTAQAALDDGVNLQVLMVRDKRKEHNQRRWVEGHRESAHGKRAVIVDDFMRAGSAVPLVEQALADEGIEVEAVAAAVFFDMWEPLGSRQIGLASLPVLSLYTRHDVGLSRDAYDAVPPSMTGRHPALIGKPLWWRFELNRKTGYPYKCVPAIADGAVFVADDQSRVWRHNAETGDIEWRYESLADPFEGMPQRLVHVEGSLLFGGYDGTITRLDAWSGKVIWRRRQDTSVHATPEIDFAHRRVYVNTEHWDELQPFGSLVALDLDTGRLLWSHRHAYWSPASCAYSAAHDLVVAACNDQTLIGVDAQSGQVRWRLATQGLVRGRPGIASDLVVVATESGHLHCLDVASGEECWSTRYGTGNTQQHVLVHGERVLVLDAHSHVLAFELSDGSLRWLTRLRSVGNWCPVVLGHHLLVGSKDGHIAVLNPQQEVKVWEGSIHGQFRQPPAVGMVGDRLLLAAASNDQGLQVFEVNSHYLQAPAAAVMPRRTKLEAVA